MDDTIGVTLTRGAESVAFFAFIFSAVFALFNSVFTDYRLFATRPQLRSLIKIAAFVFLFIFIMKTAWFHNWLSSVLLRWITIENYPAVPGQGTPHPNDWKAIAETVKNCVEAFAWACAGGFFVYKAFSGYLISNLSLSLSCNRERNKANSGMDYLVVRANLKKGDRGAVSLHQVRADVSPVFRDKKKHKSLAATKRLTSRLAENGILELRDASAGKAPLLNLPPGEETTFAQYFMVPSGQPCTVKVTILGGWRWRSPRTRYQWRASTISLPVSGQPSEDSQTSS